MAAMALACSARSWNGLGWRARSAPFSAFEDTLLRIARASLAELYVAAAPASALSRDARSSSCAQYKPMHSVPLELATMCCMART